MIVSSFPDTIRFDLLTPSHVGQYFGPRSPLSIPFLTPHCKCRPHGGKIPHRSFGDILKSLHARSMVLSRDGATPRRMPEKVFGAGRFFVQDGDRELEPNVSGCEGCGDSASAGNVLNIPANTGLVTAAMVRNFYYQHYASARGDLFK